MIEKAEKISKQTNVPYCLECGKCTATCPVSRVNGDYSPRKILSGLLTGPMDELAADERLFTCLTCGLCNVRCPSDVRYTELMLLVRIEAFGAGHKGVLSHGGVLHEIMRMHAAEKLNQNRGDWLGKGLQTAQKGDILYFAGCQPYFDTVFTDIGVKSSEIGRSTVKLLNALGVKPIVMPNERCCGHDLLWSGDEADFRTLAERNVAAIEKTGAKRVVTSCAECYRTLAKDYPRYTGPLKFEVLHISQFLNENLAALEGALGELEGRVTFHDPCRLGRHMGVYDPPRRLLGKVPGLEVKEMRRSGRAAICCGTSAWMNCDMYSKQIQIGRLKEARETGATTVVTSCPKCYIHFTCATSEKNGTPPVEIEIKDLTLILAESLDAGRG